MDIRRAYHRRSIKRARLQKRLAIVAMLAAAGCAAFVLQPGPQQPEQVEQAFHVATAPAARLPAPALRGVVADAGPSQLRRAIPDTAQLPAKAKVPVKRGPDTPLDPAADGGGGALRQTAVAPDDEAADAQGLALASAPTGAGLPAAAPARAGADQASFGSLLDAGIKRPLLAGLDSPVSRLAGLTTGTTATGSATTNSGTMTSGTMTSSTAETGGVSDTGGSGGGGGGTGTSGGAGGESTSGKPAAGGTGAGTGTGADAGSSADTGKPAVPGTTADPLPNGATPPKTHELPEPDSLWLTGLAAAALLLQRRRRSHKPR
jgi:hypothetical protein